MMSPVGRANEGVGGMQRRQENISQQAAAASLGSSFQYDVLADLSKGQVSQTFR